MLRRFLTTAAQPRAVKLTDYKVFPFNIDAVHLSFDLQENTICSSTLQVSPKHDLNLSTTSTILHLDGQELNTVSVEMAGRPLHEGNGYTIEQQPDGDHVMQIELDPRQATQPFELKITTEIRPENNTKLEGLYKSNGTYCTQCEAQGFRRITWFPDRPDVMSKFTVELTANRKECPILLSNGNRVKTSLSEDGVSHHAVWVDPFVKPAYLFALVAGDLVKRHDTYTTTSGRRVALDIYTQAHNADKTEFAMQALKESFQWDEDRFGLEYDLDLFNIVAVDDFNMGAMENKGLNVFNSRLVLASPETATDDDYERIQGVIGHVSEWWW